MSTEDLAWKAVYFCGQDWTTQISLRNLTKFGFRRRPLRNPWQAVSSQAAAGHGTDLPGGQPMQLFSLAGRRATTIA